MNGILSMTSLLDLTDLNQDQRGMTDVIRSSGSALMTIINDILDFSKIEAGKLDIETVPFSLVDLVESVGDLLVVKAEEQSLALYIDMAPDLPNHLLGDPTRLRQILLNLGSNAIKFTERGSVTIEVAASDRDAGSDQVGLRFSVTDTGIGLTPEQCSKLFQAFQQADTSTSRKFGGTGLGLSICRQLTELMGGEIGVESQPGRGSTFWFRLNLGIDDPAPLRPAHDISRARICAVGFAQPAIKKIDHLLIAAGIEDRRFYELSAISAAIDAHRGQSGAAPIFLIAAAHEQDLTLNLGADISRHLPEAKLILCCPRSLASTLDEATRSGYFQTLPVPLRRQRFWETLAAALGLVDLAATVSTSDQPAFAPPPLDVARPANAVILVAEDNATNRVVIKRLLDRLGFACELAGDGAEALAHLDRQQYGLLLTDFHMPEMDGFELTAAIRAREKSGAVRLPIIALTADVLPGTEQRCLDAGMDGYLTKPINFAALSAMVERFMPQALALRRTADGQSRVSETKPVPPGSAAAPVISIDRNVFDMARFQEAFGEIDGEARAFLAGFLDNATTAQDDLGAAFDRGDATSARGRAHSLKGSALSIGAVRLGQLAGEIEGFIDDQDLETAAFMATLIAKSVEELQEAVAPLLQPRTQAS
jgi:CheY-like chemotaxis protein